MPRPNVEALQATQEHMDRLKRMMKKAHSVSSRTGEELAVKWARNIAYYLYARCREFSPKPEMFGSGENGIAATHGWKIANLKNHTKLPSPWSKHRVMDIMRNRGRHRLFIASGWLDVKKIVSNNSQRLQTQSMRNGAVIVEVRSEGLFSKIKVRIVNMAVFARPFHEKHDIVNQALEDERLDLAQYISRKTHENIEEIIKTT